MKLHKNIINLITLRFVAPLGYELSKRMNDKAHPKALNCIQCEERKQKPKRTNREQTAGMSTLRKLKASTKPKPKLKTCFLNSISLCIENVFILFLYLIYTTQHDTTHSQMYTTYFYMKEDELGYMFSGVFSVLT